MAVINSSDIIQRAVTDLAINTSMSKVPTETLDKVQLTYSLNPSYTNVVLSTSSVTSSTLTITNPVLGTNPGEFWLTGIDFHLTKDATCDLATGQTTISITPDGDIARTVCGAAVITLTAQSEHVSLNFPPIKIKNGASITNACSFTVGVCTRCLTVFGYKRTSR